MKDATARMMGTDAPKPKKLRQLVDSMALPGYHAEIVERWLIDLEWFDGETFAHTERVSAIAFALASHIGLNQEESEAIRKGAILHDIGKLAVPEDILLKPGKLTPAERAVIETHPVEAIVMMESISLDPSLHCIARSHHERFDGQGYPDCLSGKNIPLQARLFAVVDVHDALSHDRCYRRAWTQESVMRYLLEQRGAQFCPDAVDGFVSLLSEGDSTEKLPFHSRRSNP